MRKSCKLSAVAVTSLTAMLLLGLPANSQQTMSPSEWLDKYDREHDEQIARAHHVHARGEVLGVDAGLGTVTILSEEMHRPDKTVSMPSMIMVFHVTNRAMLQGLESKDVVEFEAARLRNAVMITNIKKLR
ncbi:MAG: copper-binding protein [Rhodospirillales bacterium]|nr:copper-binding protein [Rhodospirillales bacterium]